MDEWSGRKSKFEMFETTDELGFSKDSFQLDEHIFVQGLLVGKHGEELGSQEVLVCQVDEYGEPVQKRNGEINVLATLITTPNGRRAGSFGRDEAGFPASSLDISESGVAWVKAFFEGDATYAPCESSTEMIKLRS